MRIQKRFKHIIAGMLITSMLAFCGCAQFFDDPGVVDVTPAVTNEAQGGVQGATETPTPVVDDYQTGSDELDPSDKQSSTEPTPEPILTDTPTPVPTATNTPTPEPTDTPTPVPTATNTPTPEPTATNTPTPTSTDTPTPTNTPTPKPTNTPAVDDYQTGSDELDPSDKQPSTEPTATPTPDLVDTQAPFFLSFKTPSLKIGSSFDIHKYVSYIDDVDRNVELTVDGNLDMNTAGKYTLKLTIKDDAGHEKSQNMTVTVFATTPTPTPTPEGWVPTGPSREAFSDFIAKYTEVYKGKDIGFGIDVSRWQETVDFQKVKAAGAEFVYMRIGGLDDGELYTDTYYKNNIKNAKAAGLKVGIYWHAEEANPDEVRASVQYLMSVLDGVQLDFPIAYDWEDFINLENYKMNLWDINNNFAVFEQECESYGYSSCLYGSKYYLEKVWITPRKRPVWVAQYASSTSYAGEYFMWQHGSNGKIDGISGNVDLDIWFKDVKIP